MNFISHEPEQLSACSSDSEDSPVDIQSIIQKNKLQQTSQTDQHKSSALQLPVKKQSIEPDCDEEELDQIQLEMLVEECEELISKISPSFGNFHLQEETIISDIDESFTLKKQKNRLEKEYIDLCLQIQRQQKQLQNYKFKVQVAQKQAEYYSRQIKQKTQILQNLQKHSQGNKQANKGRQSFRR